MLLKPTAGAEGTRQAFAGLQPQCCVSVRLPQGEEWKINEELRKAHFQGYRYWKGNENWKWRERFKLSASSSGKSYKWRVNVNIPTEKWKTTKESFREGLDWNYKHPGQSSLRFIPGCPSIWDAQTHGHWTYRHSPGLLGSAFHEEGPCVLIQRCFSSDPAWAQQPISPMRMKVNLGKPGTLKTFWRIFFSLTMWYNSFSKEKKIWVKTYMWFCWQSLMSKAEQNGQKPLPIGTDCGALFTPEHPKSSQPGLWFSPVLSLEQFIPKWEYCSYQSCAPYDELLFLEKDLEEGLSLLRRALELRNQEDASSWE